jgi:hypothetical protein
MMEKEVMAEVGAWKNFDILEDYLTLEELIELFDIAQERQSRLIKTVAAAFGAEIDDSPKEPRLSFTESGQVIPGTINSAEDAMLVNAAAQAGFNLISYDFRDEANLLS